jgi:5'-phosphate synthase pdxT subunit
MYARLGIPTLRVKTAEELASVDRLILPGGESTTMLRFIKLYNMFEPLREFVKQHPTWGICAGSILLAQEVINPAQASLGAIDITAHRNFYGSQIDSFVTPIAISLLDKPIEAHFIRAPLLNDSKHHTGSAPLETLATLQGQPVFFAQGNVWACSFHVELGSDPRLHALFAARTMS